MGYAKFNLKKFSISSYLPAQNLLHHFKKHSLKRAKVEDDEKVLSNFRKAPSSSQKYHHLLLKNIKLLDIHNLSTSVRPNSAGVRLYFLVLSSCIQGFFVGFFLKSITLQRVLNFEISVM